MGAQEGDQGRQGGGMTNLSQRGPQVRERSPGWRDAPQRQLGALEAETRAMPAQVPRHSTRTTNLLR